MPSDQTSTSILVVDENDPLATALVVALVDAGYGASLAHGAAEAGKVISSSPPDLVVLDIKAPAPAGLAVASALRKKLDDVPLLFISAVNDDQTAREAAALGAIAYLMRPANIRQIIPSIRTAVARAEDLRRLRQSEKQLASAVDQNRTTGAAVGILVERLRLDRQEAFEALRRHARSHRRSVIEVAEQLVSSAERVNAFTGATSPTPPRRH